MATKQAKHRPPPTRPEDFFEAPTRKQNALPSDVPPSRSTKKLPKAEIDALLKTEREKSGTRPALSESVIESFERAELRSAPTIPAPADLDDDFQLDLDPNRDPNDHDKP